MQALVPCWAAGLFWVGGVATAAATEAAARYSPSELLKVVDAEVSKGTDQTVQYETATAAPGKPPRTMFFESVLKGTSWRRVEFLAPPDMKGMRVLVRSPTQMYIYLPAFRKVRRIASHVQEQGFMGTAWDYEEMSLAVFGEQYQATGVAEHPGFWTLALKRREGQTIRYATLEVDVRKDLKQPIEIRYFNEKGQPIKTETRLDFACGNGFCTPKTVRMVDHTRGELETTMTLKKFRANTGVPDSFFTVRALQRGQ